MRGRGNDIPKHRGVRSELHIAKDSSPMWLEHMVKGSWLQGERAWQEVGYTADRGRDGECRWKGVGVGWGEVGRENASSAGSLFHAIFLQPR